MWYFSMNHWTQKLNSFKHHEDKNRPKNIYFVILTVKKKIQKIQLVGMSTSHYMKKLCLGKNFLVLIKTFLNFCEIKHHNRKGLN